ncbi:MAG: hypothetical protein A3F68_03400 [Acidobacteria bacterium RIFCSPLOWO2_12_FULL_54_10]|nr:MAG: hypothetical protein A3F68_03400 [Acidobacteria bacterium RIFCSPLOWO2_12_FULL_54_10]
MKLSLKAFTIAGALVWGGYGIFLTGLANMVVPSYGEHFLLTFTSVYPGYHASRTVGDLLVGTLYGMADGGAVGFLLAWLYNLLAGGGKASS